MSPRFVYIQVPNTTLWQEVGSGIKFFLWGLLKLVGAVYVLLTLPPLCWLWAGLAYDEGNWLLVALTAPASIFWALLFVAVFIARLIEFGRG